MSSSSSASDTDGAEVITPTPALAHPSTTQIQWSWRYQLWPALIIGGFFALLGLGGIVLVLVHGPAAAGSTYLTRAGTRATVDGSYFDSLVPFLGPAIGGLFVTFLVWYATPHRRIRRYMKHHPWTRWHATVRAKLMITGRPDPTAVVVTLRGTDGREHELYADKIYRRQEYGWNEGEYDLYFAGRPDVRGIVVRTLGDVPSMLEAAYDGLEREGRAALAKQRRA